MNFLSFDRRIKRRRNSEKVSIGGGVTKLWLLHETAPRMRLVFRTRENNASHGYKKILGYFQSATVPRCDHRSAYARTCPSAANSAGESEVTIPEQHVSYMMILTLSLKVMLFNLNC